MRTTTLKSLTLAATLISAAACGGDRGEAKQASAATPAPPAEASAAPAATAPAAPAAPAAATPAPAAPAQANTSELGPDEIVGYTLTMDKVRANHRADMEMARAFAANPSLKPKPDMSATSFEDAMLRAAQGSPTIMGALSKEGLTPRESMLISMSLMQATLAAFPEEAQGVTLTARVKPENVALVRANKAELDRMQTERAAAKRGQEM
jgi:hypothetical protein